MRKRRRRRRRMRDVARRVTSRTRVFVKLYHRFQRYNYLCSPRVTSQPLLPRSQFSLSLLNFLKDKKKTDRLDIHPSVFFVVFEYSHSGYSFPSISRFRGPRGRSRSSRRTATAVQRSLSVSPHHDKRPKILIDRRMSDRNPEERALDSLSGPRLWRASQTLKATVWCCGSAFPSLDNVHERTPHDRVDDIRDDFILWRQMRTSAGEWISRVPPYHYPYQKNCGSEFGITLILLIAKITDSFLVVHPGSFRDVMNFRRYFQRYKTHFQTMLHSFKTITVDAVWFALKNSDILCCFILHGILKLNCSRGFCGITFAHI